MDAKPDLLQGTEPDSQPKHSKLRDSNGWDGKLRMPPPKQAILSNPENYSDEDAPPPDLIAADEDLLDGEDPEVEDIDLVHCRISSVPALKLDRFTKLQRLCLRQNAIQKIELPPILGETLTDIDLYDNLISHIQGLDACTKLTNLDLSFNKIKHIKNLEHLTALRDLYLVQNRIAKIENLDSLKQLRQIELGGNRIRSIENLDQLPQLEELWLGKNKIVSMSGLANLTSLKILDLKSNRMTSISDLSTLTQLEELYLSHNAITSLPPDTFPHLARLRVLDISSNRIAHLANLAGHLPALEEFWASDNEFASFAEVQLELGDKEKLSTVYLEGNPLQREAGATYRNKVRLALPGVGQIDACKLFLCPVALLARCCGLFELFAWYTLKCCWILL